VTEELWQGHGVTSATSHSHKKTALRNMSAQELCKQDRQTGHNMSAKAWHGASRGSKRREGAFWEEGHSTAQVGYLRYT